MMDRCTRFPIRGVLWYQGETNGPRAWQYRNAAAGHDQMLARCLGDKAISLF